MPPNPPTVLPLKRDYFSGGANLTGDYIDDRSLAEILNDIAGGNTVDTRSGGRPLVQTTHRIEITIDPIFGDDDAEFILGPPPEDPSGLNRTFGATMRATLKTLEGVSRRIPYVVRHEVHVFLPAGTVAPNVEGTNFDRAWKLGGFKFVNDLVVDEPTFSYISIPGVYVHGTKSTTIAEQFAIAPFNTTTIRGGTALTLDAHRGQLVEITVGTGAGQVRRVIRNATDGTYQLAQAWTTAPDATSKFRTWKPGSTIDGSVIIQSCREVNGWNSVTLYADVEVKAVSAAFSGIQVSDASANLACSVVGQGAPNFTVGVFAGSVVTQFGFDTLNDPLFGATSVGPFLVDGQVEVFQSVYGGAFNVAVTNRHVFQAQDCVIQGLGIDEDGDVSGARHGRAAIRVLSNAFVEFFGAVGAGAAIKRHNSGVIALRTGRFLVVGAPLPNLSDHATDGIRLDEDSVAELGAVASTTPNGQHGVVARNGCVVMTSAGSPPTITGASGDLRLGDVNFGETVAWSSIPSNGSIAEQVSGAQAVHSIVALT
jgi:hypothetical protein